MKNLYLILVLSALVACTGSSQKEKPACVNTPVEPFTGLPVFDLQEQYRERNHSSGYRRCKICRVGNR